MHCPTKVASGRPATGGAKSHTGWQVGASEAGRRLFCVGEGKTGVAWAWEGVELAAAVHASGADLFTPTRQAGHYLA